jgi:MFS family permease
MTTLRTKREMTTQGLLPAAVERKNLALNVAEGGLYISTTAFLSFQTVLPALVVRFGGSNAEVGLVAAIAYIGSMMPQLFVAGIVGTHPWKKPWAVKFGTAQRFCILAMGVFILIFGSWGTWWVLWGFLALYTTNQIIAGVTSVGWFEFFAKMISPKRRGRLIGYRNSLGGLGAFFCGFVLTWLLGRFAFPLGYAVAFMMAFVLQMLSVSTQLKMIELDPSPTIPRRPFLEYVRDLRQVLAADKEFARFLVASAFLIMAMMPQGFFIVHVLKDFHADESVVGLFTLSMVLIQVVSALVVGFVADHYSNKTALLCAASGMLLSTVGAIVAPAPGWFVIVFGFLGVNFAAESMLRANMTLDYAPPARRSSYLALMNTLMTPFFFSGFLGGFVADLLGYRGMFTVGACFSVIGITLLVRRVRDPRALARSAA